MNFIQRNFKPLLTVCLATALISCNNSEEKKEEPESAKKKIDIDLDDSIPDDEKNEPIVTALPHKREDMPIVPEDDKAWGAIPSFLRRHKK